MQRGIADGPAAAACLLADVACSSDRDATWLRCLHIRHQRRWHSSILLPCITADEQTYQNAILQLAQSAQGTVRRRLVRHRWGLWASARCGMTLCCRSVVCKPLFAHSARERVIWLLAMPRDTSARRGGDAACQLAQCRAGLM